MSTKTKNYEFVKPELTDTADITAMNENWDKVDAALKNKYDPEADGALPISKGGTGSTSATAAITNLGGAKANHKHDATDINSGTLSSDRLPTIPISKGGTGAADASKARENLGITQEYWTFTLEDGSTVTKLVCAT